ncbi:MAG TPA: glycosyltransferase [Alphaproteobacteria bacterium]|nr:glycosyltransferase [Alphaproteobacteria bacterium]
MTLNLDELRNALAECQDVEEDDVRAFLESEDRDARVLAAVAVARTKIRQALAAAARLAREYDYQDQASVTAVERLANLSDIDEPFIETLKQIGIRAAAAGRFDGAMQYLQLATTRGAIIGQRRDKRSRPAIRYGHDREIDAAIASLARLFKTPHLPIPEIEPFRIAITCSGIQDEDGPTVLIMKRAEHFKKLGYEVSVVSSGGSETNSQQKLARLAAMGVPFFHPPSKETKARLDWLIAHFEQNPVHAISWTTSLYDNLGKLAATIGLAPVQAWENRSLEPFIGKWDLIYQGVDSRQEQITEWPGISKYYGSSVMMGEEIDAAAPLARSLLGVPEDAVLLGTFGRMEKANTSTYQDAMSMILKSDRRAWLLLAGRDGIDAVASLQRRFAAEGVLERVRFLGPRQSDAPALNKTVDIYCDTYPWVGGQTLLDAMQGGRPIVAMLPAPDADLDPTGVSSITSVATSLLSGVLELARAGDAADYARIALRYVADPELRARDGAAVYEKASRDCNAFEKSKRYAEDLRAILVRKLSASGITVSARQG